jgi:HK97 family phage major capsid protein
MDLVKRCLELIREGKSLDDVKLIVLEEYKSATPEEIVEGLKQAQDVIKMDEQAEKKEVAEKEEKEFESRIEKTAEALVEKKLEEKKIDSVLEQFKSGEKVVVKEDPTHWYKEAGEYIQLQLKKNKSVDELTKMKAYEQKSVDSWMKIYDKKTLDGIIAGTDAAGGAFMPYVFDMEVDKLIFKNSGLLAAIKKRKGDEKTVINSMSTFNFVHRTDENATFTSTRPTYAQSTISPKDTGAIVNVSNSALRGSAYNLMAELIESSADSKIRAFEKIITTGKASTVNPDDSNDTFAFNSMWFTSSVSTIACKNSGGTGKIVSSDLTNLFLTAPSQTRAMGVFLMDSRELMVMMEEVGDDGQYKEPIVVVNNKFIHKKTGKEIIPVDNMIRTLNSTTGYSGTDIPVIFAPLDRFRFYEVGGMRIDTSQDRYFEYDQLGLRMIMRYLQGVPTYSLSSIVLLTGVKYSAVS